MEKKDIAAIIMSAISLAFSLALTVIGVWRWVNEREEKRNVQAPLLVITSIKLDLNCFNNEFPESYVDPQNSKFILAKRAFRDKNKPDELKAPELSLFINTCAVDSVLPATTRIINLDTITLRNVGAELKKFEIDKIEFKMLNRTIEVEPSAQNYAYQWLGHFNDVKINLSFLWDDESNVFDTSKVTEDFLEEKFRLTGGELIGVTFTQMPDIWDSMVVYFTTYPLYGKPCKQTITVSTANKTYSTFSELVKNNTHTL